MAAACLFLVAGTGIAEEIPVNITATPRIYKSAETSADTGLDAGGAGARLNYNFENGGNSVQFVFSLSPPLEGPLSKILVTAKGSNRMVFLILRDASNRGIAYRLGPLAEEEQTFAIDPAMPAMAKANEDAKAIEYPIKAISFTVTKTGDEKGFIEISKIVAVKTD